MLSARPVNDWVCHPSLICPRNQEVEQAVLEYQRLFAGDAQKTELQHLRRVALEVMKLLEGFEPRLVGSVLKGTANALSDIHLHVFSDDAKSVAITFLNADQSYQSIDRRMTDDNPQGIPGFRLSWEGASVEILVFPYDGLRAAPPSPVDGKPMRRANIAEVGALLEDEQASLLNEFFG